MENFRPEELGDGENYCTFELAGQKKEKTAGKFTAGLFGFKTIKNLPVRRFDGFAGNNYRKIIFLQSLVHSRRILGNKFRDERDLVRKFLSQ